jgi:hypothetical protein
MREAFSQHFATDPERREKLWEQCLFVFDTNVLTGIYRRSEEARDAQYKMMVELGDRLWVPHRVIYEFLDNRAKIVHEQAQLYAACIGELQGMLANFEVATKHPFLSEKVYSEFNSVSQKVIAELEVNRAFHDNRITDDDVKLKLAEILDGKVGPPFTEERIVEIVKDGEVRYAQNIPPGFEDRAKHKGSNITEEIRKRYGDLIIWYQVIEQAKAKQLPVILITGDQKPDWWAEQSGKKLGPHPALIDEFKTLTGQDFYLYSYHSFLNFANQYLNQKTSAAVIEEVRESAMMDAQKSDDVALVMNEDEYETLSLFDTSSHVHIHNNDFGYANNPAYQLLEQDRKEVLRKMNFVERQLKIHKNVMRSVENGPDTKAKLAYLNKVATLNKQIELYVSQLDFIIQEMSRLRSESVG